VAVGKLREALDDNADDPRYIETIPKRGYRFLITEVRRVGAAQGAGQGATLETAEPREDIESLKTDATPLAASQKHKPLPKYAIAAAALLLLAVAGVFLWPRTQVKALTDKDALVLADFANATGNPVFDGTLRQGLSIQLEQSPFLSIIPDEKIQKTLGLMGQL
jgi:hypothetical protein